MKVALLSAIVFGAISAAASSSQALADDHYIRQSAHAYHRSHSSDKEKSGTKSKFTPSERHSGPLVKRLEEGTFEIGKNAADFLKSAVEGGKKSGDTIINHYGASTSASENAAGHMRGGAGNPHTYPPPYSPPRAYPYPAPHAGFDPAASEKLERISTRIDKLKNAQKLNSQQIGLIQEMEARKMMMEGASPSGQGAAAAQQTKHGFGAGTLALAAGVGVGGGWLGSKIFDTKPATPDTAYSPEDLAALQGAGGAAPGTVPVDGTASGPPPQGGQGQSQGGGDGGQGQSQGGGDGGQSQILGPYFDQATGTRYVVDGKGYFHFLGLNNKEIDPPPGWSATGPLSSGTGGAGPAAVGGAGSAGGNGAGSAQAAGNGAAGAPQDSAVFPSQAGGDQSGSKVKPIWDPQNQMFYVIGPNNVKFYIDNGSGYLINSVTMDVSDPKTGQIIMKGDEVLNGSSDGGDAAGGNTAGSGAGGNTDGSAAGNAAGNAAGGDSRGHAGGDTGRMTKRSIPQGSSDGGDAAGGNTDGSGAGDSAGGDGRGHAVGNAGRMTKYSIRHRQV
ncbi:hypothetical protein NDA16_001788 [Ustilago loliicola]|nr:hypothetical protein NDA16_001788 [Ustilago loliicola]